MIANFKRTVVYATPKIQFYITLQKTMAGSAVMNCFLSLTVYCLNVNEAEWLLVTIVGLWGQHVPHGLPSLFIPLPLTLVCFT